MTGITGLKVFVANFYDKNGEYLGKKVLGRSFYPLKKKTFHYQGAEYLYKSEASRSRFTPFPFFMDYYFYSYQLDNPFPLDIHYTPSPKFSATALNSILKSDVLVKLNNVRKGGLLSLFTLRNIIILALIAFAIYYFTSGGDVSGLVDKATQPAVSAPAQPLVGGRAG